VLGVVAVLATLGAACSHDPPGVRVTTDEALTNRARALAASGGAAELRTLTDFGWDTVHVFGEGATRDEIEAAVGDPVIRGSRYLDAGQLLVFQRDGDVVRAVSVVPDLLSFDRSSWPSSVRLESTDGAPGVLRLVDG
jgi:acetaldehyde dehydrogenase (acetylating)